MFDDGTEADLTQSLALKVEFVYNAIKRGDH
jgi:hypothetical protein